MRWLKKRIRLLLALVEALAGGAETVSYPKTELELPKGYRGAIQLDEEKCIGCGLCVRDCPAHGLELNKESKSVYRLTYYPARCAYCGQCERACHRQAITHTSQLPGSTTDPESIIVILKDQSEHEASDD
jgi:formate hydrogenlyase subunit 6/NADH:ubiquinone oxidoreductase subunit I